MHFCKLVTDVALVSSWPVIFNQDSACALYGVKVSQVCIEIPESVLLILCKLYGIGTSAPMLVV